MWCVRRAGDGVASVVVGVGAGVGDRSQRALVSFSDGKTDFSVSLIADFRPQTLMLQMEAST